MIFKRVANLIDNSKNSNEKTDSSNSQKSVVSQVKFYSLKDIVKAERILNEVSRGNLVFINISRISEYPTVRNSFLKELKDGSKEIHGTVKMVSDETIMIAPPTVAIEIKTLSNDEK